MPDNDPPLIVAFYEKSPCSNTGAAKVLILFIRPSTAPFTPSSTLLPGLKMQSHKRIAPFVALPLFPST